MADKPTNADLHRRHLLFLAERWAAKQTRAEWSTDDTTLNTLAVRTWLDTHGHLYGTAEPERGCLRADLGFRIAGAAEPVTFPPNIRDTTTAKFQFTGHAAVWYRSGDEQTEYDMSGVVERFAAGAFTDALKTRTQKLLWSHDSSLILASVPAGTLSLSEDSVGLSFTGIPPQTSLGRHFVESVRRGDADGASIGFVLSDDGVSFHTERDRLIATVHRVSELWEISIVGWPAYTGTDVRVVETGSRAFDRDFPDDDVEEEHDHEQREDDDDTDWDAALQWLDFAAAEGRRALARHCSDSELRLAQERGLL